MKRIFTLALIAICFVSAVSGQEKKTVAVYVTGNCNENIRKIVVSKIIAHIVRSKDYAAVERTEDFNAALRREQNYQYSGNVDDGQIIKLGKRFGAGLVCVADASTDDDDYYYLFTARLINIETGLVISFSLVEAKDYNYGAFHIYAYKPGNGKYIKRVSLIDIADSISTQLLRNVTTTVDRQKLAVYVTGSSDVFKGKTVSSRLIQKFTNSGPYAMVDRTSDFKAELRYQQSGKVDDEQLSRLGRQFGINLVCVVDVLSTGYTAVRMINVETGIIVATAESLNWRIEYVDAITKELLSQTIGCSKKDEKIPPFGEKCCEGLTLVNGVCRDLSSNVIYWIDKSRLGFEVMYEPVEVSGRDIILKNKNVCPAGWRMSTKAELERMIAIKDKLNFPDGIIITSDSYIAKKDPDSSIKKGDLVYWGWNTDDADFCKLPIGFSKKEKITIYKSSYLYCVKCVRD